jgi:uncharacterized iron-regulated protein
MGCRSVSNIVTTDRLRNFPAEINVGDIVHVATGEKITFAQLADSLDGTRIVYVGESHSNRESHELELQVLKEFYKRNGGNIAIGMEMFKRPHQDILDKWTAGEISEKELLFSTDWDEEWGYDYKHYKGIMDFTRDNKIPVVALNIKRAFQKKISRNGIESLSEEERKTLPEIDTTDVYHRKYLERIMNVHGHGDTDMSEAFERFYLIQCVWEDVMADSILKYLSSPDGKERKMLVFIGGGHVIYHFGVPKRVYRSNHLPYLTITTYELRDLKPEGDHPLFASDIPLQPADYVNVVELSKSKEPKVMLGVIIRKAYEEKEEEEEGKEEQARKEEQKHKVAIESVREGSPAGKAGLKVGDIILSMDGESVDKVFDVIYHVRQKKAGDTCLIEILRGEEEMPVEVTFFETKGHGRK